MNDASSARGLARVHRAAAVLSAALLVFIAFAVYSWIASDGRFDSAQVLGILVAVMALPTAFVVLSAIVLVRVGRAQRPTPERIRYSRILKPSAIAVLALAVLVGVAASFAFDSLGRVDLANKMGLFFAGAVGSGVIAMLLASLTSLVAYVVARRLARSRRLEGESG